MPLTPEQESRLAELEERRGVVDDYPTPPPLGMTPEQEDRLAELEARRNQVPTAPPPLLAPADIPSEPETPIGDYPAMIGRSAAKGLVSIPTFLPDIGYTLGKMPSNIMLDKPALDGAFPLTQMAHEGVDQAFDAAGVPIVDPEGMAAKATAYGTEFVSGGMGATAVGKGLTKMGVKESSQQAVNQAIQQEAAKRGGAAAMAPVGAEVATGAGAGVAQAGAEEVFPDNPVVSMGAALAGGAVAPKVARGAYGTAKGGAGYVKEKFRSQDDFTTGSADQVDKAAKLYQDTAIDKDAALKNIEEGIAASADDVTTNTTAAISDDVGLGLLERTGRIGTGKADYIKRDRDLTAENKEGFGKLAPEGEGAAADAVGEFSAQVGEVRGAQGKAVEAAQEDLQRGQVEGQEFKGQAKVDEIAADADSQASILKAEESAKAATKQKKSEAEDISLSPDETQEAAGKSLVEDVLEPKKVKAQDEYAEMIAPFADDKTTQVSTSPAAQKLLDIASEQVDSGVSDGLVNAVKTALESESITPSRLLALDKRLRRAVASQRKTGDAADRLTGLELAQEALGDVIDSDGMGADFAAARAFYRDDVAPKFSEGASKGVLKKDYGKFKNPISESTSKYFQPGTKGGESMDQLISASGGEATTQVRNHVMGEVVDKFYDTAAQDFNVKGMRKYMTSHKEALERAPEVRDELKSIINRLDSGQGVTDLAEAAIPAAKKKAGEVKKQTAEKSLDAAREADSAVTMLKDEVSRVDKTAKESIKKSEEGALKSFLKNEEPRAAIKSVFSDKGNITKNLTELAERAAKDKSGKATNGLKSMIYDHLSESVFTKGDKISTGKLSGIERDYQDAMVKSGLWKDADVKVVETVRRRLNSSDFQSQLKGLPSDSSTAELGKTFLDRSPKVAGMVRSMFRFMSGGFAGGTQYSMLKDSLRVFGGSDSRIIEDIIHQASLNPELGKVLLKRDLTKYDKSLFKHEINKIMSTRTALAGAQDEDDE